MKRSFKKEKGINPTISTIILVAVAITVALAVAIRMGGIREYTIIQEEAKISHITYGLVSGEPENIIVVKFENLGTTNLNITKITINGVQKDFNLTEAQSVIKPGEESIIILCDVGWVSGKEYATDIRTSSGSIFIKKTKAP